MNMSRLPAAAIALSVAVLASAAGASAQSTDTPATSAGRTAATSVAQPVNTNALVALATSPGNAPLRTVGNVNASSQQAPDITRGALTPLQMNAAYDRYVLSVLRIDPAIAHTP